MVWGAPGRGLRAPPPSKKHSELEGLCLSISWSRLRGDVDGGGGFGWMGLVGTSLKTKKHLIQPVLWCFLFNGYLTF